MFTTLWCAIDLAAIVADAELIQIIRLLSTDLGATVASGIRSPQLIEQTKKCASDRLAGLRP